jgi:hypothetical protein
MNEVQSLRTEEQTWPCSRAVARRGGVEEESYVSHDVVLLGFQGGCRVCRLRMWRLDLNSACPEMEMSCGDTVSTRSECSVPFEPPPAVCKYQQSKKKRLSAVIRENSR